MIIEKGVNSYVELAEAENYIDMMYDDTEGKKLYWDSLTDIAKEKALIKSCALMQKLKFNSNSKYDLNQVLVFPRVAYSVIHGFIELGEKLNLGGIEYPDYSICQIEQALTGGITNKSLEASGGKEVKSISIGKVSESYFEGSLVYAEAIKQKTGLTVDAYEYIKDYFKGGV